MTENHQDYDVAIVGGGLAGLTLALQLRQCAPNLSITILERSSFPVPAAAHKVGEATVEIGAHYLSHVLGLEQLLEETQLRKFGLRLFFGSGRHSDLAHADELGASRPLPAISYQLDRGTLENSLAEMVRNRGIDLRDSCAVSAVTLSDSGGSHRLSVQHNGEARSLSCRWLVDASSRSALLKRKLDIARPCNHRMSAAWLRLDKPISVDDWSSCSDWQNLCNGLSRRPSTNHLMGSGYWAWLIPLAGDRTSVGLVTDPDLHPLESINNFDKFRRWLDEYQPLLAAELDGATDSLMDFRFLRNLSQDSENIWSSDRWALTGEAGLFADPFYSPGSDFIGMNNTFICDLISKQRSAAELSIHATIFERIFQSFFASTMTLYEGMYRGFGDTRLMVVKSTWDYAYYWSILAWLFFRDVLTDLDFLRHAQTRLEQTRALNADMQAEFRKRALEANVDSGSGVFFDQIEIPVLAELNAALLEPQATLEKEFASNCDRLTRLAPILLSLLAGHQPGGRECNLVGDLERRLSECRAPASGCREQRAGS